MILGVDPGLRGAFALYDPSSNTVPECFNVPIFTLTRNGKVKSALDLNRLVASVRAIATRHAGVRAVLELVGAMPGQGVSSMFSFGVTAGAIETAIVAAGIPYQKITPQTWKKALSCPADKDGALLRAGQLIPAAAECWAPIRGVRDKEDCKGLAEAALIAYYGATKIFT